MSKHTPEPWYSYASTDLIVTKDDGIIADLRGNPNATMDKMRIEHCVRACTGMPDPQVEIAALREAVRVLGAELACIRRSWKGESEDGGLTWFNVDDSEVEEYGKLSDATDRNPIAAAAVKGTQ